MCWYSSSSISDLVVFANFVGVVAVVAVVVGGAAAAVVAALLFVVVVVIVAVVVPVAVLVLVLVKSRQFGTHLFPLGKGPKNQQHTTPGVPRQCEPTRGHGR